MTFFNIIRLSITHSLSALLILFAGMGSLSCSKGTAADTSKENPKASGKVQVRMIAVEQSRQRRAVQAVGSLLPYDEVVVSSEAEGRVEQVLVDIGDRVVKGQTLARLSPVEFELSVEQQQAALRQARARLGLQNNEGELKDVRQAAEVKKAAADLADAEQRYRRAQSLLESGVIARQTFDEAEAKYNAAKATYDVAAQAVENMRASMQQTQATLNLASKRLRDTQIRAPFAGRIKSREITTGQYLKIQSPVVTIVNIDPLRVRLTVPEKMSPWVQVGREVGLTVEAFPGREFSGRVSRINPSVDEKSRSFEIEALVPNHSGELKPGSFVKSTIQSEKVDTILTIPYTSATYVYGAYKVFLVEGGKIKEREVKLGDRIGDNIEIIEGLKAEDKIAVVGSGQTLKDGMEVEVER